MNRLSGLKDVDREILKHVSDKELLGACSVDRRMWNEVCDDSFLRRRLNKYPGIEIYKDEKETWKQFFLRTIYYISKMQEVYKFQYTAGDFKKQYEILHKYIGSRQLVLDSRKNVLLSQAAEQGELSLVQYALQEGANIHANREDALIRASQRGHLNVVKYLVERGSNVHADEDSSLRWASYYGHLEVVKYLVENGADIHAVDNNALKLAAQQGHSKIVNYLKSLN